MIVEQYATPRHVRVRSQRRSWPRVPVHVLGRERVIQALGQSVLVQLMLAMSFIALAALLYLAQANQATVLQFNIVQLQAERTQLMSQNAGLRATATTLQSIQRIDTTATSRLHMARPDPASAVWVAPILPQVTTPPPLNADTIAAEQQSQPLSWMRHFITLVKSSL